MPSPVRDDLLVWIDLEMTGLDPGRDVILELATLITDPMLEVVAEGPVVAIRRPPEVFEHMSDVVRDMHTKNGLLVRCQASTVGPAEAEMETLRFMQQHCKPGSSPMCGNSVWVDRLFVNRQMPAIDKFLHYRCIDVSTVKELARRWRPDVLHAAPQKADRHRALDDIRASIGELKHYRSRFFQMR